jgi:hypothetical protein
MGNGQEVPGAVDHVTACRGARDHMVVLPVKAIYVLYRALIALP